jgi:hypothetical protein
VPTTDRPRKSPRRPVRREDTSAVPSGAQRHAMSISNVKGTTTMFHDDLPRW